MKSETAFIDHILGDMGGEHFHINLNEKPGGIISFRKRN